MTRTPVAPSARRTRTDRDTEVAGLNFTHLKKIVTEIGIWQHCADSEPNTRHGYSIDDVARALIVGLRYWQAGVEADFCAGMAATCLDFIRNAAISRGENAGKFHNFCDADGFWLDPLGSEDSFGRTLWGLGVAHAVDAPFAPRSAAGPILERALPRIDDLKALRAKAFCILGLAPARVDDARLFALANGLSHAYETTASEDWRWFEDGMTYCNARLPQALLVAAGIAPDRERWLRIGVESLDFLLHVTHSTKGGYSPIGNQHLTHRAWFRRGEKRPPLFDQQPVDAGALVEACVQAHRLTGEPRFRKAAQDAFGWYFGLNVHSIPVYNPENGGVADAITRSGISRNMGAESVLSIHLANLALNAAG